MESIRPRQPAHLNSSRQISRQMRQAVLNGVTGKLLIKLKMMGLVGRNRSRVQKLYLWTEAVAGQTEFTTGVSLESILGLIFFILSMNDVVIRSGSA